MYTLIKPGNVVDFMFDDIYLADSTSNEPESKGYVIFKVHPNSFIYNGTYVDNKSEIYFDFNPPIVTNTVYNTLVNVLLTCDSNMGSFNANGALIYPNPSSGSKTIEFETLQEVDITLYNLSGQAIYSQKRVYDFGHRFEVDGPSGVYILEISSLEGKQYYKVVLEYHLLHRHIITSTCTCLYNYQ